ncbi:HNH endonuclease [Arthrobacter sp. Helios]|uniref:HNH endonuclease n=1 Tax=Arthrobacter sp. Helios TaxID=2828862 RepID=UPI002052073B|nr:HNH endonuclease [Arthrobacter sp. Helios]UPO77375.1 HNH endonuclease [Arthrobacter sp. Helios]
MVVHVEALTHDNAPPTVVCMGDKRINWTRDEIILACDLVWANDWRALDATRAEVVELAHVLRLSPLHSLEGRPPTFRNPAGVGRKTSDIATRHPDYKGKPTNGNRLDLEVLQDFLARPAEMHQVAVNIRSLINNGVLDHSDLSTFETLLEDEIEAPEGRLLRSWVVKRERDRKLRQRKIQQVKQRGDAVTCSVCSFDFLETYGERGRDYIEVHHVIPLHISGQTITRLDDLGLLCSNCHRMIHRGVWLTPEQLKNLRGKPTELAVF